MRLSPWMYKCHNCGATMTAEKWMKKYHPQYYRDYIKEILQINKPADNSNETLVDNSISIKEKIEETKEKIKEEKRITNDFIPILEGNTSLFDKAIQLCKKRMIPEDIWKKFYVASENSKDYYKRLIIPFYDHKDTIYYFQARTLIGQTPKYINRKENKDNAIYNWYNIDKTKPVVMTEGPIDSMFIENAIATCGLLYSPSIEQKLNTIDIYYLIDPDKDGIKKARKLLSEGKRVFLWTKFIKEFNLPHREKWDINELVIYGKIKHKIKFEYLKKFFSSNIYDGIYL